MPFSKTLTSAYPHMGMYVIAFYSKSVIQYVNHTLSSVSPSSKLIKSGEAVAPSWKSHWLEAQVPNLDLLLASELDGFV